METPSRWKEHLVRTRTAREQLRLEIVGLASELGVGGGAIHAFRSRDRKRGDS